MKLSGAAAVLLFLLTLLPADHAAAQSLFEGDISGRVTDPAGLVVPDVSFTLTSLDNGTTQITKSNGSGLYRFALLKPGRYQISSHFARFADIIRTISIEVGVTAQLDFSLQLAKSYDFIEVVNQVPLLIPATGSTTPYSSREVSLLPAPGGDITTIAFTAPGILVAPASVAGNFTANGLPANSNLFTVNGENAIDPYYNVNSSGASNLTLGLNEVQEASVVTNPYSGQYGQLIGAQVAYATKSGTNQFHGNAEYWWNGSSLNADNWLNNATGGTRPFSNANQWAASFGGPIRRDKSWFFLDTEGLRFDLPSVDSITVPTPAFASAVLANIQATQPKQLQAYKTMMNLWASAAQGHNPVISPSQSPGCVPGVVPGWMPGAPCSENLTVTPATFTEEWILAPRFDFKLGPKDDLFVRVKIDHGVQPTYVDPISSKFDALSNQPSYDGQVQARHTFNSNATNAVIATISHYDTLFQQNAALVQSTFPYNLALGINLNFTAFNPPIGFPTGRNVTEYQLIDDFTWTQGKHLLQLGANFRRVNLSDHDFEFNTPQVTFQNISTAGAGLGNGLQDFANGIAFQFIQADNQSFSVPIASWGLDFYISDTWKWKPTFSLTMAMRLEHNSNPVCQHDCFANFTSPFSLLPSVQAANSGSDPGEVPYSSDIKYNQHRAYPGVDAFLWSPRLAFNWAPAQTHHFPWFQGGGKTAVSGGFGLFYDALAVGIVDPSLTNPPVSVILNVQPPNGTYAFDTTASGSAATFAAASALFSISKSFNQLEQQLSPLNVAFPAPSFAAVQGTIHSPQAQEWNLKVEQEVAPASILSVNYVGNHVIHLLFADLWLNAFDCCGILSNVPGIRESPVVPNYGTVGAIQSGAVANYNGVTVSLRQQYRSLLLAHINYTFSHTFDEVSNGGFFPYSGNSLLGQNNPVSLRAGNYGNAEYDVRHVLNADFVLTPSFHFEDQLRKGLFSGWQLAGKIFLHSGFPFSILDGNLAPAIVNGGGHIFANQISPAAQSRCGHANVFTNATPAGCINLNAFTDTASPSFTGYSAWPDQARNQFRGPGYFEMDLSLYKDFQIKEGIVLGVGLSAYNALNHPNFGQPDNTLGDGTTGQIFSMQGAPTSPYGSGLGFDFSARVVQLVAKLNF